MPDPKNPESTKGATKVVSLIPVLLSFTSARYFISIAIVLTTYLPYK